MAERTRAVAEYRASGLTQREFARGAGVSVGTLQNWLRQEQGRAKTSPVSFVEMAPLVPASLADYKVRFAPGTVLEIPRGFAADHERITTSGGNPTQPMKTGKSKTSDQKVTGSSPVGHTTKSQRFQRDKL